MIAPFHIDPPAVAQDADELGIQTLFRNKMRTLAPAVMLVAIPNAGKRTAYETRTRMREGMVSGFPDLMALWNGRVAFLEFKARKGSIADKQIDALNKLARNGFAVGVFRSADTATDWLREHGAPFL